MEDLSAGLWISLLGVVITFFTLTVLIGFIVFLRRLFPAGKIKTPPPDEEGELPEIQERQIAAIAAAWFWQSRDQADEPSPSLGDRLAAPPDSWWQKGVADLHGHDKK